MAEIILLEKINKLGSIGDKVKVKDGYARNYLLPRKKALRATKANIEYFKNIETNLINENSVKKQTAEQIAAKIENTTITLVRQASEDGRLFGSVTSRDIVIAFAEKEVKLDRSFIDLKEPIKNIGTFEIDIALHAEVKIKVNLNITRLDILKNI